MQYILNEAEYKEYQELIQAIQKKNETIEVIDLIINPVILKQISLNAKRLVIKYNEVLDSYDVIGYCISDVKNEEKIIYI